MTVESVDLEIRQLADLLNRANPQAKAAIFGVCGRALAPLLGSVEARSAGRWTFPEISVALDLIEWFATDSMEASDHTALRARLMDSIPHGDDLGAPWSTYAQDAIICADAGLAAASPGNGPKSIWIQYTIEPLMITMEIRDAEIIRLNGTDSWGRHLVHDPTMKMALGFVRKAITELSGDTRVGRADFHRLVEEGAILRPAGP